MVYKAILISHFLWQYLNQPVLDEPSAAVWHPRLFWYLYRVQLLESCWQKNITSESHSQQ